MKNTEENLSLHKKISQFDWSELFKTKNTPLNEEEYKSIKNLVENTSIDEVNNIYIPLSSLLNNHFSSLKGLSNSSDKSSGAVLQTPPFIIGVAGSVASGKSTFSKIMKEVMLIKYKNYKIDIVTTDGFLYPNSYLQERNLMGKKGFPESYDVNSLFKFLSKVKNSQEKVYAPIYSHQVYDVLPSEQFSVDRPDILILEGINVLQEQKIKEDKPDTIFSDFFNFSIFIDARENYLSEWFLKRFLSLRSEAVNNKDDYFHKYASISDSDAISMAKTIWEKINLKNLNENILPTKKNADLILKKNKDHKINEIWLRNT